MGNIDVALLKPGHKLTPLQRLGAVLIAMLFVTTGGDVLRSAFPSIVESVQDDAGWSIFLSSLAALVGMGLCLLSLRILVIALLAPKYWRGSRRAR
jgi:hypothetical protein